MAAVLHDISSLQYQNTVAETAAGQAMGNEHCQLSLHQRPEFLINPALRQGVQCSCGFIQYHHGSVLVQRPGNGYLLPLPSGHLNTLFLQVTAKRRVDPGDPDADFINGLPDSVKKATGIDKETAEEAFRDYYTASLLVDKLTANVSTEISEDEARVITIQQIFLSTENVDAATREKKRTDAQEILNQAQSGQDFSLLAKNVNESEIFERELSRGESEQALEAAAFALGDGEVSPLVETEKGFYLIRCVDHYDEVKTAQNKEALGKKHKEDCFYEYYYAFVRGVTAEYNQNAWDEIDYRESYELQEQDFYTVYSQFFPV